MYSYEKHLQEKNDIKFLAVMTREENVVFRKVL